MLLEKLFIDVAGAAADGAQSTHRLLALVAANEAAASLDSVISRQYSDVMVYLHGFPDVAVHLTKLDFASRLPFKLAEAWLEHGHKTSDSDVGFLAFNFGGVIGSDEGLTFYDKTLSQEVADAVGVCAFVREKLLRPATGRLHVVGISTGAIIGSLLRGKHVADTISVIAGLADLHTGIQYDFTDLQRQQIDETDACWKEFYLPDDCPVPANATVSLDGVVAATLDQLIDVPRKVYLRLHRRYYDECVREGSENGRLDIRAAVGVAACPFLVIHGDADKNVPFADGQALFEAAAAPKDFVAIAKGNHLLTNSKHLKKALTAIVAGASRR